MRKIFIVIAALLVCSTTYAWEWPALIEAVAYEESRNNPDAYNAAENAVGLLQIRQAAVDDLNRVYLTNLSLEDFYDKRLSVWAFKHYGLMYGASTAESFVRIWNGGPTGCGKASTLDMWNRVKSRMAIDAPEPTPMPDDLDKQYIMQDRIVKTLEQIRSCSMIGTVLLCFVSLAIIRAII